MQDAVLATLLVIDHELHSDPGLPQPVRMRGAPAIADEIARVGSAHQLIQVHATMIQARPTSP